MEGGTVNPMETGHFNNLEENMYSFKPDDNAERKQMREFIQKEKNNLQNRS